jgi:hypothetical protein
MRNKLKGIALAAGFLAAFGAGQVTHVDAFPSLNTYGITVGTNDHYCSLDIVGWHPDATCESAS